MEHCSLWGALQLSARSAVSSLSEPSQEDHSKDVEDDHGHIEFEPEPLDEDLYGVAVSSLIRDIRKFMLGDDQIYLRFVRAAFSVLVLWFILAMQVFLIWQFKLLITQASVHKIRTAYSLYEKWMYEGNVTLSPNGFARGIVGHFNNAKFADLDQVVSKKFICSIPLSQPATTMGILAVWTLTVLADFRKICFFVDLLLVKMPTVRTVEEILTHEGKHTVMLCGLTGGFKGMLLFLLFLPRAAVDIVLLWLGCRWLLATARFEDLLLNAIALEFILLLKEMMYKAMVPKHTMLETRQFLVPHHQQVRAGWSSYLGAFVWAAITASWVVAYIFKFQQVLPDYRWDIHSVCEDYLKVLMAA
jgi:hypothetical protein